MVVIKNDVNKALLFLIIIPILVFIVFSTYYDNKLKNISMEYNRNREEFEKVTAQAILEQLNETLLSKEIAIQDKEIMEENYFNLKTENEDLRKDRDKLKAELDHVNGQLEMQKNNFNILQARFQQIQSGLSKANDEISRLIARNQELCRKLKEKGEEC